jgi:hypothetical protein
MRTKHAPLKIKTVPSDGSGEFTGLASTFGGEPDWQGDVVQRGAFLESIDRWRKLGDLPPVGLNHNYSSASSRIGKLTSMQEIPEGLLVSGRLNLKSQAALDAYEALLTGALDAMSIGYAILEQRKRADGVNVLTKLDLIEVSFVPVPANPRARVLSVKSAAAPAVDRDDRDVIAKLDHLELDTLAAKGRRSEQLTSEDVISLRNHLHLRHGSQITWEAVERMGLSELQIAHAMFHPNERFDLTSLVNPSVSLPEKSLSDAVDKMIASVRAEKAKEQADADWFRAAQESLLSGPIDWAAQDEREAERRKREDAELERRAAERAATADAAEAADAIRRTRGWRQTGPTDSRRCSRRSILPTLTSTGAVLPEWLV